MLSLLFEITQSCTWISEHDYEIAYIGKLYLQFSVTAAERGGDVPQVLIHALIVQVSAHQKDIIAAMVSYCLSLTRKLKYTFIDYLRPELKSPTPSR